MTRRVLFNWVACASLLACLAIIGVWIRSYHTFDVIQYHIPHRADDFLGIIGEGKVALIFGVQHTDGLIRADLPDKESAGWSYYESIWYYKNFVLHNEGWIRGPWKFVGFQLGIRDGIGFNEFRIMIFPLWFILALCSFPAGLWLWKTRLNRKRVCRGLCAKCGYDLRASPDRCPECGSVSEANKPAPV